MYKIKDMPEIERPRERLKIYGVENLSDEELISILLKTGSKSKSVKVLASEILATNKGLLGLKKTSLQSLMKINGVGESKALVIIALLELSKRINSEVRTINNLKITNPEVVFNYYKDRIGDERQEIFFCLYLDSQKKVISEKLLFKGTVNKSTVHPREIFKFAFLVSASSIICVHNHPSGSLNPSSCDIEFTKELKKMGDTMGVKLNDHVIITCFGFYSFYDNSVI